MAVIKLNASGQIILRGGLPSCTCCCSCDYTISEIFSDDPAYFSFLVRNNCPGSTITVTSYNGLGNAFAPILPVEVVGNNEVFFFINDPQLDMAESFTITIEECGESDAFPTPPPV